MTERGLVEADRTATAVDRAGLVVPVARKSGRFVFVDALRGVAALWVVIYHAYLGNHNERLMERLPGWAASFVVNGHLGVPIFFVLSGFVIAFSVSRYRVDLPFIGRFIVRRSIRLDPPYWASMALMIVLGLVSRLVVTASRYELPGPGQALAHFFYVQGIFGYPQINDVYWTLSFEIQFYLVFCLLMGLAHAARRDEADNRSLFVVFVPALAVAALWPLGIVPEAVKPAFFPPLWHGFLLGMLACWAMERIIHPAWFYAYAALLGIGGLWNDYIFTVACVLTSVLLLASAQLGGLGRWLDWPWLQFLGRISYSLYLLHNPITGAFYNAAYRVVGRSLATQVLLFGPMLAANIACAAAMWWLVERPSLALAHHFNLRRKKSNGMADAPPNALREAVAPI